MEHCVVDKVPERAVPPHRRTIEEARQRQLDALQSLRRLLMNTRPAGTRLANG